MKMVLPFLCCLASQAMAQDRAVRAGDEILTRLQLLALTSGTTLIFFDDGQSKFSAGEAYSYTYSSGASAFGRFEIGDNGMVCLFYRNGRSRCDRYVLHDGRLVLLTGQGQRFPVREHLKN